MHYLDTIETTTPLVLMVLLFLFGLTGLKLSGMGGAIETDHPILYAKILLFLARGYYVTLILSVPVTVIIGGWKFDINLFFIYLLLAVWIGLLGILSMRQKTMVHRFALVKSNIFNFFLVTTPLYLFTGVTMMELFVSAFVNHF